MAIVGPSKYILKEKGNGAKIDSADVVYRLNNVNEFWPIEQPDYIGTKCDILFTHQNLLRRQHKEYGGYIMIGGAVLRLCEHVNQQEKLNDCLNAFPTCGMVAIYDALIHSCKTLYVTGFTFFQAADYDHIYRPNQQDPKHANTKHAHARELELFKILAQEFPIYADSTLAKLACCDHLPTPFDGIS